MQAPSCCASSARQPRHLLVYSFLKNRWMVNKRPNALAIRMIYKWLNAIDLKFVYSNRCSFCLLQRTKRPASPLYECDDMVVEHEEVVAHEDTVYTTGTCCSALRNCTAHCFGLLFADLNASRIPTTVSSMEDESSATDSESLDSFQQASSLSGSDGTYYSKILMQIYRSIINIAAAPTRIPPMCVMGHQ
jgi:hypothetical protein